MNILVAISSDDLLPLRVMLGSLFHNNPGEQFTIYLAGEEISAQDIAMVAYFCDLHGHSLRPIHPDPALLPAASTFRWCSKTLCSRLLAGAALPVDLDRALYLDPNLSFAGYQPAMINLPAVSWALSI